jgi:hypothetical protein
MQWKVREMWYFVFGTVCWPSSHVLFVVSSHKIVYICVMKVLPKTNHNCAYFHIIIVMLNVCEMYIEFRCP